MSNRLDLSGKVAVVTGGARGIGRAYALALAEIGADVIIADIRLDAAKEFAEELTAPTVMDEVRQRGRSSWGFEGDLSHADTCKNLIEESVAKFGRVDVLVNNAGGALAPVETSWPSKFTNAELDLLLDVNLRSTIACCQAVAPVMKAQGSGSIINTSSMLGLDPGKREGRLSHYGMIKTAIAQYTRFLAAELGPDGIRVNCIAPGSIATARILRQASQRRIGTEDDELMIPLRRLGTPADCAGVVCFLASELSSYVSGQCISVCGGRVLTPS